MSDTLKGAMAVAMEIVIEREKQIARGFDHQHDDRQRLSDLAWLLARRANDLQAPSLAHISQDEPRRLLVEIAAIAVAAVESIDRRAANDELNREAFRQARPADYDDITDGGGYIDEGDWTQFKHEFVPFTAEARAQCIRCRMYEDDLIHS